MRPETGRLRNASSSARPPCKVCDEFIQFRKAGRAFHRPQLGDRPGACRTGIAERVGNRLSQQPAGYEGGAETVSIVQHVLTLIETVAFRYRAISERSL